MDKQSFLTECAKRYDQFTKDAKSPPSVYYLALSNELGCDISSKGILSVKGVIHTRESMDNYFHKILTGGFEGCYFLPPVSDN
ncbi:hypothetical protein [Salmonirosea aquatica]|uniref:Uncharacterized protein n=1 Tax=Salmonirosea aquatica TaxID=2654236 RepID=A0A7C9BGP4_9BACT|nr:hypothetical protein [Cytophagaceae bacterium SJW1-29]MPR37138.1 hypothetical protein [Cytophagaceae bacterium SJW1-29]